MKAIQEARESVDEMAVMLKEMEPIQKAKAEGFLLCLRLITPKPETGDKGKAS